MAHLGLERTLLMGIKLTSLGLNALLREEAFQSRRLRVQVPHPEEGRLRSLTAKVSKAI